jgi:ATP-dependent helicase HrpB
MGRAFDEAPWVTRPPQFAVEAARQRLVAVGAMEPDGALSGRGRQLSRLPVSASEARVLLDPPRPISGQVADLVALSETGRDLLLPFGALAPRDRTRIRQARAELFAGLDDEVSVQLRALARGDSRRHGLHGGALAEARRIADRLRTLIGAPKRDREVGTIDRDALAKHLLARVPESAFVPRPRVAKKFAREDGRVKRVPWANGSIEIEVRPFEPLDDRDPGEIPTPRAALILDHEWLGLGRKTRGVGRLVLPCPLRQLAEAGIGELEVGDLSVDSKRSRVVVSAKIERKLAGVVVSSAEERLCGAPLRSAVAQLVLEGRRIGTLPRTLGEEVLDGLHTWALLASEVAKESGPAGAMASTSITVPPAAGVYLEEQLERLGLDDCSDLSLLEAEDLQPDLDAMAVDCGLDPRRVKALREDFPRRWTYQDGVYACEVDLDRRRVTLQPVSGKSKSAREPPAAMLPRFRGFRVDFHKASRRVRLR